MSYIHIYQSIIAVQGLETVLLALFHHRLGRTE